MNNENNMENVYLINNTNSLRRNNPYVRLVNEETSFTQNGPTYIPDDLLEKAIQLDQMNCSVRFIAGCDLFMSFYYYVFNGIIGLFATCSSLGGIIATINYKRGIMFCYVVYQGMQVMVRSLNLGYYILILCAPLVDNEYNEYNNTNKQNSTLIVRLEDNPTLAITFMSVMLILQVYIAHFIYKYYNLLPSEEDIQRLRVSSSL